MVFEIECAYCSHRILLRGQFLDDNSLKFSVCLEGGMSRCVCVLSFYQRVLCRLLRFVTLQMSRHRLFCVCRKVCIGFFNFGFTYVK